MNISRRGFLAGVGAGLAGLTAGTGYRKLIPFVIPADNIVPGVATWYASTCRECPGGCGMLLRNREARVVKAEGNPLHPVNAGKLCARGQASLQGLYDPDRLRKPRFRDASGAPRDAEWEAALAQVGEALRGARRIGFISDLQSGSLSVLIGAWLRALGGSSADYLVYEPFNYESLRAANARVFGRAAIPEYRLDRSDFVISFGADFLETWLSPVQFTRQFTAMRKPANGKRGRFVYVGPRRSLTAVQADRHILVPPGGEGLVAQALLVAVRGGDPAPFASAAGVPVETIRALADEFQQARTPLALAGSPLALGADDEAAATAAAALNRAHAGAPVSFERVHALGDTATLAQTRAFLGRAAAGEYDAIVILGANPLFTLPPELKAAEALRGAKHVISLNSFADETVSTAATWALPVNAPAESWGDYSPWTGVRALMQPAMGSTFDSRDAGDVLLQLAGAAGVSVESAFGAGNYYDYLRARWMEIHQAAGGNDDFETFWQRCAREGCLTSAPVAMGASAGAQAVSELRLRPTPLSNGTRLYAYPSLHFFDGRHANKRWLQEIPDPMTRAVWGSWVELHPETARALKVATGDLVELKSAAGACEVPAHVWEGVAPNTAALAIGQGHTAFGRYAQGNGVNAFALLQAGGAPTEVTLRALGRRGDHVVVHGDTEQHGREIVQTVALSALASAKASEVDLPMPAGYRKEHDVYKGHDHLEHRWAMALDLDKCNGCNACVVACYSENNIPVVGKKEVRRAHDQPWLRIDRYDEGEGEGRRSLFLPVMCQQCDSAPCETVCPVYAAVHGNDGLNEQVYNRCVGTRYCSNNCPYKARRFNWFRYEWPEPLNYQLNPDVTVRERGVMEKCTFCVQRIKEVTIKAKAEGRAVKDGEITPACAQTCPSDAFVFGDLQDPESRIARLVAQDPRRYQVLRELNTKPAVFYLKKIV